MASNNNTQSQDDINKSIGESFWYDFTQATSQGQNADDAMKTATDKNVQRNKQAKGGKGFFARWGKK